ncbi:MAG: hypothetical protein IKH15_06790 [Bacteroidales bacterium]|nr:hypothetical protein [Bacteroidales bacterium]MBR7051635.1 hypothetical protein [Bacteroidaceae bacterium]
MTDIEKIAEEIIREAVRRGGAVGCDRHIGNCSDEEWEKAKNILQRFGAVMEWNDGQGGFKFTVNAEGKKFNAAGGFEQLRRDKELRDKEVEAAVSAAESAAKSARSTRRANVISVIAMVLASASLAFNIIKECSN